MSKKSSKKSTKKKQGHKKLLWGILTIILLILLGVSVHFKVEEEKFSATIEYTPVEIPAFLIDDQGEIVEEEDIPTVIEEDK